MSKIHLDFFFGKCKKLFCKYICEKIKHCPFKDEDSKSQRFVSDIPFPSSIIIITSA